MLEDGLLRVTSLRYLTNLQARTSVKCKIGRDARAGIRKLSDVQNGCNGWQFCNQKPSYEERGRTLRNAEMSDENSERKNHRWAVSGKEILRGKWDSSNDFPSD